MLRSHWFDAILNVHAATEDKSDDINDRFYEELECVCNNFLK